MKVVSNSSVLIALSSIGQLQLLSQRFPSGVLIPSAVWQEVVETGKGRAGAKEVKGATWLTVQPVTNYSLLTLLRTELDAGESEAITLAIQTQANLILLDEREARKRAEQMGLMVLGTVGMLIWAKRAGLIPNLQQLLDTLQKVGHFRLSAALYKQALNTVGEGVR